MTGIGVRARFSLLVLLAVAYASAWAQRYPSRPLKVILPVPAGGYYDTVTRIVSQRLAERLGQPVVVENRVGAGGITGTVHAAGQPADGYTLLFNGIGAMSIFPSLHAKLAYDPVRDFEPILLLSTVPNILVVHPSVPAKTVGDLAALAASRPGEVTYASNGIGTTQHLAAEMFATAKGLKLNHIPFNGSAPAVTAMLGGQTMLLFGVATDVMPHVKAGKLRALAVASEKRMPALPDIPTTAQAGVSGVEIEIWLAAFAPKGTPHEIVTRLNAEIGRVLEMPEVRERITQDGIGEVKGGTPGQLASLLQSEIVKWSRVVKASGARVD